MLFGLALELGSELATEFRAGLILCETALPQFGGRDLGIGWNRYELLRARSSWPPPPTAGRSRPPPPLAEAALAVATRLHHHRPLQAPRLRWPQLPSPLLQASATTGRCRPPPPPVAAGPRLCCPSPAMEEKDGRCCPSPTMEEKDGRCCPSPAMEENDGGGGRRRRTNATKTFYSTIWTSKKELELKANSFHGLCIQTIDLELEANSFPTQIWYSHFN